ncbi:MAG: hypothetical protein ACKVJU_00350 [Verrucomicrobiales bacterium]
MRHLFKWEGRNTALSDDGYRLNKYHGVTCFLINDQASTYRFQPLNNGLPAPLRNLYLSKTRSGTRDQVVVLYHHWDESRFNHSARITDRKTRPHHRPQCDCALRVSRAAE